MPHRRYFFSTTSNSSTSNSIWSFFFFLLLFVWFFFFVVIRLDSANVIWETTKNGCSPIKIDQKRQILNAKDCFISFLYLSFAPIYVCFLFRFDIHFVFIVVWMDFHCFSLRCHCLRFVGTLSVSFLHSTRIIFAFIIILFYFFKLRSLLLTDAMRAFQWLLPKKAIQNLHNFSHNGWPYWVLNRLNDSFKSYLNIKIEIFENNFHNQNENHENISAFKCDFLTVCCYVCATLSNTHAHPNKYRRNFEHFEVHDRKKSRNGLLKKKKKRRRDTSQP